MVGLTEKFIELVVCSGFDGVIEGVDIKKTDPKKKISYKIPEEYKDFIKAIAFCKRKKPGQILEEIISYYIEGKRKEIRDRKNLLY